MNVRRLRETEAAFLEQFPLGFNDPGMAPIRKRHNVGQLTDFVSENLTAVTVGQPEKLTETLVRIVGRSSMVSRFEKAPFRDFIAGLDSKQKVKLASAFEKRLFGRRKKQGFDEIVSMLVPFRLARWSVVSAVPFYFAPKREAFVKPTTAKKIIAHLEIDELHYHPRPDWSFYEGYRRLINDIRRQLDPSLAPNNAAVTGLLMFML